MTENNTLQVYRDEINAQVGDKETFTMLVTTTFKGLETSLVKRALLDGYMRGFTFKDFLEKNVYAIPFKGTYSLVTSIDYARKLGMKSGVVGVSEPKYTKDKEGKIESCTVTVKRRVAEYVGEYTATVFFSEYTTGRNLWSSKPHTMIAKVAEMHALRKACPEELSKAFSEEEKQKEVIHEVEIVDISEIEVRIGDTKTLDELKAVWADLPAKVKTKLNFVKEAQKKILTDPKKKVVKTKK